MGLESLEDLTWRMRPVAGRRGFTDDWTMDASDDNG